MTKFYTYPKTNIRVIDQSAEDVYVPEELPLHRPLFAGFAEKGVGMGYGPYSELKKKFGEATFDSRSDFFKHPNFFMRSSAQQQPVFFYRLTPADAKTASVVLEAHVSDADITQYQRDSQGMYINDTNGDPIPIYDASPIITDLIWDTPVHLENNSYTLTIMANDVQEDPITYSVTCDDVNVTITQDPLNPIQFIVTYPNYISAKTVLEFTITADDGTYSKTAKMTYIVNPVNATEKLLGYWWNDSTQQSTQTYILNVFTENADDITTVTSNAPVDTTTITTLDPMKFLVQYDVFNTYPQSIDFSIVTIDAANTTAVTMISAISVTEFPTGAVPYTEPGTKIEWRKRPLAVGETITGLQQSTYMDTGVEYTVYPIVALTPQGGPGAYGNNMGIQLFWNHESDTKVISDNEALLFTMKFMDQPYGYDSPVPIRDFFNSTENEFMFYPDGMNKSVDMRIDFDSIMENVYRDKAPYTYNVYSELVKALGERVRIYETITKIPELTSDWMVNIIEAMSTEQVPYYHTQIVTDGPESLMLDKDITQYLTNGADGDISDNNLESLSRLFFKGEFFPEFKDKARWPFNHIYDSGYELTTKYALYDMLALREDVHIVISTGNVYSDDYNSKAEDQAAASALRIRALLYPESVIDGTQNCRVTLFMQACKINFDDTHQQRVMMTFKAMQDRGKFHNATFVKGEWKGLPNSSVDFIREISWAPYEPDVKQLFWDTAANYCQYYDMTRLHYPDIISVYPQLTSVLSSDTYVTYIIYLKQLVQKTWAKYAGLEETVNTLKYRIEKDLNDSVYRVFKSYIKVIPAVYQTDLDAALGYAMTVELAVYDSVAKRIWNVPVYCRRIESLEQ